MKSYGKIVHPDKKINKDNEQLLNNQLFWVNDLKFIFISKLLVSAAANYDETKDLYSLLSKRGVSRFIHRDPVLSLYQKKHIFS